MTEIKIKVKDCKLMPIDNFETFQGTLKTLPKDNLKKLKESILRNGFNAPIFLWKNKVLDGHQRLIAIQSLFADGHTLPDNSLPYVEIEADNEQQAAEMLLTYNSQYGEMTDKGLEEYVAYFNLDINELNDITVIPINLGDIGDGTQEIEAPPIEETTNIQLGDIFLLDGKHKIMCADCTIKENINRLMDGRKADLLLTDPPYNVNYSGKNELLNLYDKGNRIQTPIKNDFLGEKEYMQFTEIWINNCLDKLNDYNSIYIFGNYESLDLVMHNERLIISNMLVWVKNNFVLGRMDYKCQHEFILYGWKEHHKWYGKNNETTVLSYPKPTNSDLHPTMKPIELVSKLITNSSEQNQLIFDPFIGSGTTLIAAEQLNRICYGMEIDPAYCKVILKRYKKLRLQAEIKCLNREFDIEKELRGV
jgi:DNA modification methylase